MCIVMGTNQNQVNAVELRVGSDSDFPKLELLTTLLKQENILVLKRILSAHRTPDKMEQAAKSFPSVSVPWLINNTNLNIRLCFAAAGWSAHIAGMTAAPTNIPVIAIPVEDSSTGYMAANYSMINMPPGIPNGFVWNQETAVILGKRIMELTEDEVEKIYIPAQLQEWLKSLIENFWVEITNNPEEFPIGIYPMAIDEEEMKKENLPHIPVIIPTVKERINHKKKGVVSDRDGIADIVNENIENIPWLSMGLQIESKINATNAFLYCMKMVALFNPEVNKKLTEYREKLAKEVESKDQKLIQEQIESWDLDQIFDVVLPARYNHIHAGKVRETYQHPDNPDQLIMIATDRISTHDIVHKNRIPWKGKVLTTVSNFWFNYFKTQEATKNIPTQLVENTQFPADFPEQYKNQSIIVKKLHALPVEAIVRDRLYGSIVSWYDAETGTLATGEFVGTWLVKWSTFDETKFTPSTKGKVDVNINFENMGQIIQDWLQKNHPKHIDKAEQYAQQVKKYSIQMFTAAKNLTTSKWIILADTKFEFAIDDNGVLHIIDEVLTPDSSRYRKADGYVEWEEPESFDKQDTRDHVMETWKKNWQTKEKPPLTLPNHVIAKTQERYKNLEEIFV